MGLAQRRMRTVPAPLHSAEGPAIDLAVLQRHVRELEDSNQRLTAALVATNDELLGMYAMTRFFEDIEHPDLLQERLTAKAKAVADVAAIVLAVPGRELTSFGDEQGVALVRDAFRRGDGGLLPARQSGMNCDLFLRHGNGEFCSIGIASHPGRSLQTPQLKLIRALFAQIEGYVRIANIYEQSREHALMAADARAAAQVASMALPKEAFVHPRLDVASRCDPARVVAGDFFTWRVVPDGVVFAVGDVAGKGLPAALIMTHLTETIRSVVDREPGLRVDEILQAVSAIRFDYLRRTELFATIVIARWDERTNEVSIVNAGHSPVCVRSAAGAIDWVPASCPPLGVLEEPLAEVVRFRLQACDALVIASDGLIEQEDEAGHQIGLEGFAAVLAAAGDATAESLLERLFEAAVAQGCEQSDDRTALVVRRATDPTGVTMTECPATDAVRDLCLEPNLSDLYRIGPWIRNLVRQGPAPLADERLVPSIELVVHELAVNAIVHGNSAGPLVIDARREDDAWELSLSSEGAPFDPDEIGVPQEVQEHGYGLMIVRQLADSFEIRHIDGRNLHELAFAADPLPALQENGGQR